jgi:putative hydrolase of the HAD superfamily
MPMPPPETLLFDLGGVIIDIDFSRAFRAWQPISNLSLDKLAESFKFDAPYERHERGEITAAEYFEHLRSTLSLCGDDLRIREGWNSIYIGEITETVALVRAARMTLPCNAFTNTNAAHQAAWSAQFPAIPHLFSRIFASHEIGHRKPERAAFEHIGQALGVPLDSIMFFDDLIENIEGAQSAGLQTVHVRSPRDVREALEAIGCALF